MGGIAVYLIGFSNLKKLFFGGYEKTVAEEAERRRKMERRTILRRENLQDTQGTINNRIAEMEKDLKRMKVVISVEKDTISLEAKKKERARIPKYVKKINKRMQSYNPKLKLYKAEPKAQKKSVTLREHYENWHGKVGGDLGNKYDEVDFNSMNSEEL
jgi:hypothetical protein